MAGDLDKAVAGQSVTLTLADALGAPRSGPVQSLALPDAAPTGKLTSYAVGASIARHMPEGAIICDDAVTSGAGVAEVTNQLLFDDVLWVENAKRDHFDFMTKMRERGIDVVEMHNLLEETIKNPEALKWILDRTGSGLTPEDYELIVGNVEQYDQKIENGPDVRWMYLTAWATEDGRVNFRPDVYSLDGTDFIFGQPEPKTF